MPAQIISLAEYRRRHPTRPPFVAPGEPAVVLVAAVAWVSAWWLVAGIAAARAIGRAM